MRHFKPIISTFIFCLISFVVIAQHTWVFDAPVDTTKAQIHRFHAGYGITDPIQGLSFEPTGNDTVYVKCMVDGVVVKTGDLDNKQGQYVLIKDAQYPKMLCVYSFLENLMVHENEAVSKNGIIGYITTHSARKYFQFDITYNAKSILKTTSSFPLKWNTAKGVKK